MSTTRGIAIIWLLLVATATADESPESRDIVWSRFDGWSVTGLELVGAPAGLPSGLRGGLALLPPRRLLPGGEPTRFQADRLRDDLARIGLFLARRGYPHAVPVATIAARDDAKRNLKILIRIEPGPAVRVAQVALEGWPAAVAPDTSRGILPAPGTVFVDEKVEAGGQRLQGQLRDLGYPQAVVGLDVAPAAPDRVSVTYKVQAGEQVRVTGFTVTGCRSDLVPVALRVLEPLEDRVFSASRVEAVLDDLRLTRLFRHVALGQDLTRPGQMHLHAELEDARMRTWDAAVGTWTDNPWMIRSSWTHRNLFSGGRGGSAHLTLAAHEIRFGVGVFRLGWLTPRDRTRLGARVVEQNEDAYRATEFRVELLQSFRPRGRDVLNVGTAVSENRIDEFDPTVAGAPDAQGLLWELWVERKWDRTDDPLTPRRGGFARVLVIAAEPGLLSEIPYAAVTVDGARYLGVGGGAVLAGRARFGAGRAYDREESLLANRRFHAGGYNTHRGYRRRALGPRDAAGDPRGGEAVLLAGCELRVPLFWRLEGALFVDAGNVWDDTGAAGVDGLPVAAGGALSVLTPVGPLRVGYAVNIANLQPDEPRRLWHFGIGYPW